MLKVFLLMPVNFLVVLINRMLIILKESPRLLQLSKKWFRVTKIYCSTVTEIYDYLKVMFSRIGKTIDPESKNEVKSTVSLICKFCAKIWRRRKFLVLSPGELKKNSQLKNQLTFCYSRLHKVLVNDKYLNWKLQKLLNKVKDKSFIIIDRLKHSLNDEDYLSRVGDSFKRFLWGFVIVLFIKPNQRKNCFYKSVWIKRRSFIEPTVISSALTTLRRLYNLWRFEVLLNWSKL